MRNFDQRMDEIRRRSEELKLKQRKRRKLALTIIPAALCVALCAAAVLPGRAPAQELGEDIGLVDGLSELIQSSGISGISGAASAPPEMPRDPEMYIENFHSMSLTVTGIQITGKGVDKTIDDLAVVAEICTLWERIIEPTPNFSTAGTTTHGRGDDPGDGNDGETTAGKAQPKEYYTVSFLDDADILRQYWLNKSVLMELATGETDLLTEDDMTALYQLLGITAE